MQKIVVICGATASGKSSFGMEYCLEHNGAIVSADSMQIYQQLNIGTAKPTIEDRRLVQHYCVDMIHPSRSFSVAEWVRHADNSIQDIIQQNKIPVIVGGTGLYIRGLLYDHQYIKSDPIVLSQLQTELEQYGVMHMYEKLSKLDKEFASIIHPNDTKKVIRALEIYQLTGQKKSSLKSVKPTKRYDYEMITIELDRGKLYDRVDNRVDEMVKNGFVDEVKSLMKYKDCQSMQAIGYKQLAEYFGHNNHLKYSVNFVIDNIKQFTRNFAKRQLTYFRNFNRYVGEEV